MKIYRRVLLVVIFFLAMIISYMVISGVLSNKPGDILLVSGKEQSFSLSMPYSLRIESDEVFVSSSTSKKVPADKINIDLGESFDLEADSTGSYKALVYLFNVIPVDTIRVDVVNQEDVYIGGNIIGIALNTKGILVLGSGPIKKANGVSVEPARNILKSGDYIVEANGEKITDKKQFVKLVQDNGEKTMKLKISRNDYITEVEVTPVRDDDGTYKIGVWIRDDTAGVGTLTFYDPDSGKFGTLGHGITDVDTGTLLNIESGEVYRAHVLSINKGVAGQPGEIVGSMSRSDRDYIGEIDSNSEMGVFGNSSGSDEVIEKLGFTKNDLYSIGSSYSVKKGYAQMVSCVLGTKEYYDIEITEVDYGSIDEEKTIHLKVTDERLLRETGGIIQGTSGSPIIQDGKLIGAVTHVTIDDPEEGYGIFIESMLEYSK